MRQRAIAIKEVGQVLRILESKLARHTLDVIEHRIGDYTTARKVFSQIQVQQDKKEQARALLDWCLRYVSQEDWKRLKAALRKRRQRRHLTEKQVTLSTRAHDLLQRVAKRDEVTYSEVLERLLSQALKRR